MLFARYTLVYLLYRYNIGDQPPHVISRFSLFAPRVKKWLITTEAVTKDDGKTDIYASFINMLCLRLEQGKILNIFGMCNNFSRYIIQLVKSM